MTFLRRESELLGNTKAALARLQGRSIVIPNQGLLINSISLQEAKASSAIENIFTTDDELYKAYSQDQKQLAGPAKEVLSYREALWTGYEYLQGDQQIDINYFASIYRIVTGYNDGIRPPVAQVYIKEGGTGPNAGKVFYYTLAAISWKVQKIITPGYRVLHSGAVGIIGCSIC